MSHYFSSVEQAERIRCRPESEGKFLLYNPRTDQLHLIGPLAKKVFDLCDGSLIDDIIQRGQDLIGQEAEHLNQPQLLQFLCELHKRDLVVMR